jgi:hypothetical protein
LGTIERGLRFIGAVFSASFVAGPLFVLSAVLIGLPFSPSILGGDVVSFAMKTIPFGVFLSFLPNLIGATVMTGLGALFRPARSVLAWIGAGAAGGLLCGAIFGVMNWPERASLAAMILTGMACAAICRAFTRWPEEPGGDQA